MRNLYNVDVVGNENGKKVVGLYQQNNNFARAFLHAFLYIS